MNKGGRSIKVYVIVYVGYEGIEHIVDATASPVKARVRVLDLREIAEKHSQLTEEEMAVLGYPQDQWTNPSRFCVMTQKEGELTFACCCEECGVPPSETVLY